jgi:hypothetical protein
MKSIHHIGRVPAGAALTASILLSACGGGGDSTSSDATSMSDSSATTYTAQATQVPTDTTTAEMALVQSTESLVALTAPSTTVSCPGGGTAIYTVSTATSSGVLIAGITYTLTFNACSGLSNAAVVTGVASVAVTSYGSTSFDAGMSFNNLAVQVTRANGASDTVTLNGGSRFQTSTTTSGVTTTQTAHLTAPSLSVTTAFSSGRTTTYSLSAVDMLKTVVSVSGVVSSTSYSGTTTLQAQTNQASASYTVATQGAVTYSDTGTPLAGNWLLTLPNNALSVNAVSGTVKLGIDLGGNGTIDRTITLPISEWLTAA